MRPKKKFTVKTVVPRPGFTGADAKRIVEKLTRWDASYHAGTPDVSDAKYDRYRDMLARSAPDHPYLKKVGAPVAKTARGERARSRKEALPFMIGSLDKTRPADLPRWMEAIASKEAQKCWLVSPKFDGASVSLRYVDGRLDRAWTRGDGVEGQVVTEAARHVQGVLQTLVPNKAFSNKGTFVVRGEVVMHRRIFDKFYALIPDDKIQDKREEVARLEKLLAKLRKEDEK